MKTKKKAKAGVTTIDETMKFIESPEMASHLRKWLLYDETDTEGRCADIIRGAPVSLEHKLQTLKRLGLQGHAREVGDALNERHGHRGGCKNPPGTVYRLLMYDQPEGVCKMFNSYDNAIDCIKRTRTGLVSDRRGFANHRHGRTDVIEKWIAVNGGEKLHIHWFLDDAGNVLYHDFPSNDGRRVPVGIPGRLRFPVPFKPGDMVDTDCRPFAGERKVVVLENADTPASVDGNNVTCIFVNGHNNIDAGYFKSNDFLDDPEATYVSVMYRAVTCKGGYASVGSPLETIADAVRKNARLGNKIFGYMVMRRVSALCGRYEGDASAGKYYGTEWKTLKAEFGL